MFQCSNFQMFKHANVQKLRFSNVPMFKFSNVPIFQCSNFPMIQCSKYSNVQMFQSSRVPRSKVPMPLMLLWGQPRKASISCQVRVGSQRTFISLGTPVEKTRLWRSSTPCKQPQLARLQRLLAMLSRLLTGAKWINPCSLATTRELCSCHLPWRVSVSVFHKNTFFKKQIVRPGRE